jgi:hypothetical protein
MATPTVLDTLKDTTLRAINWIEYAQDGVAGSLCDSDHEGDMEMLHSVKKALWDAVAVHVSGVQAEYPHYTDAGYKAMHTYDDGTTIVEQIELREGSVAIYFPRHDGDRDEFIQLLSAGLRASLSIVGDPNRVAATDH